MSLRPLTPKKLNNSGVTYFLSKSVMMRVNRSMFPSGFSPSSAVTCLSSPRLGEAVDCWHCAHLRHIHTSWARATAATAATQARMISPLSFTKKTNKPSVFSPLRRRRHRAIYNISAPNYCLKSADSASD